MGGDIMKRTLSLVLLGLLLSSLLACAKEPPGGENLEELNLSLEEAVRGSNEDNSNIFAVTGTNGADAGVETLLNLMEEQALFFYKTTSQPQGLIAKDDVVLIKFNCQWAERGGTNTDLIKSVIAAITSHPQGFTGEVIVADNGQHQYGSLGKGGSIEWPYNNAVDTKQSVNKVVEEFAQNFAVSALTWDSITTIEVDEYSQGDYTDGFVVSPEKAETGFHVSYPKFQTQYGTFVSFKEGIWDKDLEAYDSDKLKVINMPVLKSHLTYQVTACIKHYMGVVSDKLTNHESHLSVVAGGMGTQMASTRMPALNIIDAIWINPYPGRGPNTTYSLGVQTSIIAASTDPAALDYWAAKYILMAAAEELGISGYEEMDPNGYEPGTFGYWLNKSKEQIIKGGYDATTNEAEINVYVEQLSP